MSATATRSLAGSGPSTRPAPLVVAHGAGNDLRHVRTALQAGARVVEADLRLRRGRIEVRHLKTAGPLPILWDRWTVVRRSRTSALELDALLAAVPAPTELMLDLKGRDVRLAGLVADALRRRGPGGPVWVCARWWPLLDAVPGDLVARRIRSVGTRRELRRLRRPGPRLDGISIHRRLLDQPTVSELRARADLLMTWPVETEAQARQVSAWGVHGLITKRFHAIAQVVAADRKAAA